MAKKYKLIIHGDGFTAERLFETELDAEIEAFAMVSRGIRIGNRVYPDHAIRYCEIVEVVE